MDLRLRGYCNMKENIEALERLIRVASVELSTTRPTVIEDALKAVEELKSRHAKLLSVCSMAETESEYGKNGTIYPFQIREVL